MKKKNTDTDVHTRHCCKQCGCKYGEDRPEESMESDERFISCSVVSGRKTQEKPHGKQGICNGY